VGGGMKVSREWHRTDMQDVSIRQQSSAYASIRKSV
jgi:hypothetical protein